MSSWEGDQPFVVRRGGVGPRLPLDDRRECLAALVDVIVTSAASAHFGLGCSVCNRERGINRRLGVALSDHQEKGDLDIGGAPDGSLQREPEQGTRSDPVVPVGRFSRREQFLAVLRIDGVQQPPRPPGRGPPAGRLAHGRSAIPDGRAARRRTVRLNGWVARAVNQPIRRPVGIGLLPRRYGCRRRPMR
jgi:hypothetical protein